MQRAQDRGWLLARAVLAALDYAFARALRKPENIFQGREE